MMIYYLIIIFFASLFISLLMNNFFIKRPDRFIIKKSNDSAIRFSSQTKPIFGGISLFAVFLIIMIIIYFYSRNNNIELSKDYISLFIVVILSFFMGLADDLISTPPSFKFVVQILCGFIFIYNDLYIHISPYNWLNYTITVLWVVGIMNSINMLDNMDGIASVISLSIFGGITFYSLACNCDLGNFEIYVLIAICASLLGFIFYNWAPAKMYLGDNGSQFLGALLAYFGINFFWNSVPIAEYQYGFNAIQIIVVLLAFIIPIVDTATVTINRLLRRKSPFVGGKDHTTHHLYYAGLSVRWVAITLFILNTIGVVFALYIMKNMSIIGYKNILYFIIYPVFIFLFLYLNTKFSKEQ